QRLVGAGTLGERVQELGQAGQQLVGLGRHAVRRVRGQVGVELADPVDHPVAAGVVDENVEAGAAVGQILIGGVGVGLVVQPSGRVEVVVDVQHVVAPAGEHGVAAGTTHHPVVVQV